MLSLPYSESLSDPLLVYQLPALFVPVTLHTFALFPPSSLPRPSLSLSLSLFFFLDFFLVILIRSFSFSPGWTHSNPFTLPRLRLVVQQPTVLVLALDLSVRSLHFPELHQPIQSDLLHFFESSTPSGGVERGAIPDPSGVTPVAGDRSRNPTPILSMFDGTFERPLASSHGK